MNTFSFNHENEEKFNALLTRYTDKSSLMLPSLWMVQYQEGWISLDAMQYIAKKLECSPMDVYSVASFYTMFNLQPIGTYHLQLCKTLSCMLAGSKTLQEHLQNRLGIKAGETSKDGKFTLSLVECLGSCGTSPCMRLNDDYIENLTVEKLDALLEELSMVIKLVSKNFDIPEAYTLEVARKNDRYASLDKLFSMTPDEVTSEVEKSGLRGKGGGGAHTGEKWRLISPKNTKPVYLVINADEGEPGTFKDRQILEFDPHLLIEGIICSSYAIGAHHAYVYIRGEYVFWMNRLQHAIDEAYSAGILGKSILGHNYALEITVHKGAGAYICGEKTALLESLEGKRGHPRLKPKGKEPEWFFGNPTVMNNVETIASVPFIINEGYGAYQMYGTKESPGTMLFGISGHVERPGVYELPYGTSMKEVIYNLCGGIKDGKKLKAVIPGGSSVQILRADEIEDITLDYESLKAHGSSLGTGGMIVMDETVSIPEVMKNLFEFYHHESCGQCTPCREGTGWVDRILAKILAGEGSKEDYQTILDACDMLNGKTICVFAPSVAFIAQSYLKKFKEEFEALLK